MKKTHKVLWLVSLLALLILMVGVGGTTRTTRSGLSITEWKPISGILPPLSDELWQKEFEQYKRSPEYQQVNSHFEVTDYKKIYWWEYVHRLLGRVIFVIAALLGFQFWRKKEFTSTYALFLPGLIAFQGLIGWLMVKSGLNHRPSVSHYMLTLHLVLAIFTMCVVYYPLVRMKKPVIASVSRRSWHLLLGLGVLIVIQVIYGSLTSGLRAGLYSNTFPLMGGQFFPTQGLSLEPVIRNFFENPLAVQWVHRWLGTLTGIYLFGVSFYLLKYESRNFLRPILHLVSVVVIQIALGIFLLVQRVPLAPAVFHQVMATLVVLGYLNLVFRIGAPEPLAKPSDRSLQPAQNQKFRAEPS